jgi:hypothetical protein
MRNLNAKIAEWRSRMAAGGIKFPAVLDELESHLREEIERQVRLGIKEGEAFEIAARKIGDSDLLKAEFAKVAGSKEARAGKVLGIACCLAALPLSVFAIPNFLMIHELPAGERALSVLAILLTFLSIASWRFSHKFLPVIHNRTVRLAAAVACGLAGLAWLSVFGALLPTVIVPHLFTGSIGEDFRPVFAMGTAMLWAMALTAVLGAIAYGLEGAARRQLNQNAYV